MKKIIFIIFSLFFVKQIFGASNVPKIKEENRFFVGSRQIILIPEGSTINKEELRQNYPNKLIIACDFYISDCERWITIPGGYGLGSLINIDHHAPTKRMSKEITATSLAIDFVNSHKKLPDDLIVFINHTDCDSILSSLIITGVIQPYKFFAQAAKDADHTGIKNPIADLLQGIQRTRSIEFSVRNLKLLLTNGDLDEDAKILLQKRKQDRKDAKALIKQGLFKTNGYATYALLTQKIDTALLPALLPNATIIAIACPMVNDPSRLEIAVRRGLYAPPNLFINQLNLPDGFGGRWNCGSNKRGGGTIKSLDEYIAIINKKIEEFLNPEK